MNLAALALEARGGAVRAVETNTQHYRASVQGVCVRTPETLSVVWYESREKRTFCVERFSYPLYIAP